MTDEPVDLYAWWMGDEAEEIPTPHSFGEVAEMAFREQDRADKASRMRSQQLVDEQRVAREDQAAMAAFMGRGRSHADILSDFATMSDRADAWQSYQAERAAKREEREREERQQRRIAELEAEVAEAARSEERHTRTLRAANVGWAAARDDAESFRDAARRRAYYG